MKWYEKIFFVAWFGFCFALMTQSLARAGDCSGPGDCGSVPDNNSTAAAIGGGLAGGGLAWNSCNKRKKKRADGDECQGERDAVQESEAALQALQSLIDTLQQQVAQLQNEVAQQIVQLQLEAMAAVGESAAGNPALSGILATLHAELQSVGNPASLLTAGTSPGDFFSSLSNVYSAMTGQAAAAMGLAQTGPFPLTLAFLNSLLQLQGQLASANGLLNSLQNLEDNNLKQAQNDLQKAQQALDDCRASHSGDAQSQGDSAPAP